MNDKNLPYEYKPISMWGYFGYEILFSIPFIGFILLLVFSFGGTKNINLRNFARSYFCFSIIVIIFIAIIFLLYGSSYVNNDFGTTIQNLVYQQVLLIDFLYIVMAYINQVWMIQYKKTLTFYTTDKTFMAYSVYKKIIIFVLKIPF